MAASTLTVFRLYTAGQQKLAMTGRLWVHLPSILICLLHPPLQKKPCLHGTSKRRHVNLTRSPLMKHSLLLGAILWLQQFHHDLHMHSIACQVTTKHTELGSCLCQKYHDTLAGAPPPSQILEFCIPCWYYHYLGIGMFITQIVPSGKISMQHIVCHTQKSVRFQCRKLQDIVCYHT